MKLRDGLYHRDIGMPPINFGVKELELTYSRHAMSECVDRYSWVNPPDILILSKAVLIEVEITAGRVTKGLFRMSYDAMHDLCLVVKPDGFVKTLWLNHKLDTHKTLDGSKYVAYKA
jgi:hypothetical protein